MLFGGSNLVSGIRLVLATTEASRQHAATPIGALPFAKLPGDKL
jgi:hypothetical protein